jgi:hypothetical protein
LEGEKFSLVQVRNGDPNYSDHGPVIINIELVQVGVSGGAHANAFKFEANWLQEETYRM